MPTYLVGRIVFRNFSEYPQAISPLYHIAANAGLEGAVIINKVRESEPGVGYDALKDEYVNMVSFICGI